MKRSWGHWLGNTNGEDNGSHPFSFQPAPLPSPGGSPTSAGGWKVFSRTGFALAALLLLSQLLPVFIVLGIQYWIPNFYSSPLYLWVLSIVPIYLVGFPVAFFILKPLPRLSIPRKPLSLTRSAMILFIALAVMYLSNLISVLLILAIEHFLGSPVTNPLESVTKYGTALNLVLGVILAPIFEEALFRGVLLRRLLPYGEGFAIFASALSFALIHGNLSQIPYAFSLGLVFAYLALRTGRLLYPILYHMIINALGILILPYLMDQGPMISRITIQIMFAVILLGILFFAANRREIYLNPSPLPMSEGQKIRAFLLNPGMFAYLVLSLGMVFFYTFFAR